MDVTVSARHTEVTDGLRDYAIDKIERLGRHFDRTQKANVILNVEDDRMVAEMIIPVVKHKVLTAKAVEKDMYAAIDAAADKMDRQLRKFKERLTDRRVHGIQHEGDEEQTGEGPEEEEEAVPEDDAEDRGMRLRDFIREDAVIEELKAVDKEAAIRELVDVLERTGQVAGEHVPEILRALVRREELGSTGIGRGFAVPHTKSRSIQTLVGAFGRSTRGIGFKALDGEPVHCIFLLLSPNDAPREHLAALEAISRLLRDDTFRDGVLDAKEPGAIVKQIQAVPESIESQ